MTERRVNLDLGTLGTASTGTGGARPDAGPRGEPDAELAERFKRQLADPGAPPPAAEAPAPRPFDLFATRIPEPPARADAERRAELLEETVSRMLVSDGAAGGDAEVRIRLKDDLLPGTELRLTVREGRLEVTFASSDEASAAWLVAQSESIAGELARRLKREVRVAVRRDGEGEGEETLADTRADEGAGESVPPGPASLFASRRLDDPGRDEGNP